MAKTSKPTNPSLTDSQLDMSINALLPLPCCIFPEEIAHERGTTKQPNTTARGIGFFLVFSVPDAVPLLPPAPRAYYF